MEREALWNTLREVFVEVMDNPDMQLTEATTAEDIEEWDSISHIMLIAAIEKRFRVKFTAVEVQRLRNVGNLADLVGKKLP